MNNLYYAFCFFRSIVKCMPDDCISMKLWVAYHSFFLNHCSYIYEDNEIAQGQNHPNLADAKSPKTETFIFQNRRSSIIRRSGSLIDGQQIIFCNNMSRFLYWVTCHSWEEKDRRGKWQSWVRVELYQEKYLWINHKNMVNTVFPC